MTGVQMKGEETMCGLEWIRKTSLEFEMSPWYYQTFNMQESSDSEDDFDQDVVKAFQDEFLHMCKKFESFKFSTEPAIVGDTKLFSYSELLKITDFKSESLIQKTLSGRLFRGTIGEGSGKREVFVKTWDFHYPGNTSYYERPTIFCDEMELFIDEKASMHPGLVKLHGYCYETRLAAIYEGDFNNLLSDVLLRDDFGWEDRIEVATQLADLFSWLHEKGFAVGSVTPECIMLDQNREIKVFDFGHVSSHVNENSKIPVATLVGMEAPEVWKGERTMKSDVYIFGLLLAEIITKKKYCSFLRGPRYAKDDLANMAKTCKNKLVNECIKEVDGPTASKITDLTLSCMNFVPGDRPKMRDVVNVLVDMVNELREKRE